MARHRALRGIVGARQLSATDRHRRSVELVVAGLQHRATSMTHAQLVEMRADYQARADEQLAQARLQRGAGLQHIANAVDRLAEDAKAREKATVSKAGPLARLARGR